MKVTIARATLIALAVESVSTQVALLSALGMKDEVTLKEIMEAIDTPTAFTITQYRNWSLEEINGDVVFTLNDEVLIRSYKVQSKIINLCIPIAMSLTAAFKAVIGLIDNDMKSLEKFLREKKE